MTKNNQEVKKNWFFILLLSIGAMLLAGTAAWFSVFGLTQLFYGAGIGITILAASLEFAKVVTVSYVYRFWKTIEKALRGFYIFAVIFIMFLTSMGIYGFLISGYQKSANKVQLRDAQIKISENKKTLFVNQLDRINKTIESDNSRINVLSGVRTSQERRIDTLYQRKMNYDARGAQKYIGEQNEQLKILNQDITDKMKQSTTVNDSIAYYDQKIAESKASEVSNEISSYQFIADLTGIPMNKVVNFVALVIIFVFDPLAIALLIAVNRLTMNKEDRPDEKAISTIGRFFRRFRKKEEEEEVKDEEAEEQDNWFPEPPEEVVQEPKKVEESVKEEVIESKYEPRKTPNFAYEEPKEEELEEDVVEEPEPKKNETPIEDCGEGYTEEKVDLNKSDIKDGLKIYHNTFGKGKILKSDIDKNRILILFDEFGIKELNPDYANLSEIKCVKKDNIDTVKYLDFFEDDPEIQDIIIKKPVVEDTPIETKEELLAEQTPSDEETILVEEPKEEVQQQVEQPKEDEKKTKFFQKIWKGKKIV